MEIEIRAFIDDLEKFEQKVRQIGASFETESHIIDWWFCDKEKDCFKDVQQDKPGSYGLRIRQFKNKDISEINCKVLEREEDHNAFHEYETKIDDPLATRNILESSGFKIFCTINKVRRTYLFEHCRINIENIKGFRPAVELEIISDNGHQEHKGYQKALLKKLGINNGDIINKSITHLYMQKMCFRE